MKKILSWFGYVHHEDVLNALVVYKINKGLGIDEKIANFQKLLSDFEKEDDIATSETLPKIINIAPNLKRELFESQGAQEFVEGFFKKFNGIE